MFNQISTGSIKFQPNFHRISNFLLIIDPATLLYQSYLKRNIPDRWIKSDWILQETRFGRIDHFRPFFSGYFADRSEWMTDTGLYGGRRLQLLNPCYSWGRTQISFALAQNITTVHHSCCKKK